MVIIKERVSYKEGTKREYYVWGTAKVGDNIIADLNSNGVTPRLVIGKIVRSEGKTMAGSGGSGGYPIWMIKTDEGKTITVTENQIEGIIKA